jgi:hypothetical protein
LELFAVNDGLAPPVKSIEMVLVGEGVTPFMNEFVGLLAPNGWEALSNELLLELELLPKLLLLKLLCWTALLWKKLLLLLVLMLLVLPKLLGFL